MRSGGRYEINKTTGKPELVERTKSAEEAAAEKPAAAAKPKPKKPAAGGKE